MLVLQPVQVHLAGEDRGVEREDVGAEDHAPGVPEDDHHHREGGLHPVHDPRRRDDDAGQVLADRLREHQEQAGRAHHDAAQEESPVLELLGVVELPDPRPRLSEQVVAEGLEDVFEVLPCGDHRGHPVIAYGADDRAGDVRHHEQQEHDAGRAVDDPRRADPAEEVDDGARGAHLRPGLRQPGDHQREEGEHRPEVVQTVVQAEALDGVRLGQLFTTHPRQQPSHAHRLHDPRALLPLVAQLEDDRQGQAGEHEGDQDVVEALHHPDQGLVAGAHGLVSQPRARQPLVAFLVALQADVGHDVAFLPADLVGAVAVRAHHHRGIATAAGVGQELHGGAVEVVFVGPGHGLLQAVLLDLHALGVAGDAARRRLLAQDLALLRRLHVGGVAREAVAQAPTCPRRSGTRRVRRS